MPARSKAQQKAAGAALSAKRGENATDSGGDDNEKSANDFDGLRPREVSLLATHDAIFQL